MVPLFWRFHNVHHTDLDMDVSTAARFHFGEMIFSTGFLSLAVILFGVAPVMLRVPNRSGSDGVPQRYTVR